MLFYIPEINLTLTIANLILLLLTVVLYVDYFVYKGRYLGSKIKKYLWPLIVFTTIGSVAVSLLYSEYFGFIPCSLCWLQRIAMYPQALLSVVALKRGDTENYPLYGIALSIFGFVVAVYQYIYQSLPKEVVSGIVPCLADGSGADCADKIINLFGFVTFPFLSAVSFAFLIIAYLYLRRLNTTG